LTTVNSTKENFGTKYVGTDLGFNLLLRPELYGAYHDVMVVSNVKSNVTEVVSVCGNICESGDLVAEDRMLPKIALGDILAVLDAGAYGFAMSSNYNARLRPAEILITIDGSVKIIREKEKLEHLLINQRF
jgi:diaminopimelate decarboxylase